MIQDGKPIEINCHFCSRHYVFSVEELKEIFNKAARQARAQAMKKMEKQDKWKKIQEKGYEKTGAKRYKKSHPEIQDGSNCNHNEQIYLTSTNYHTDA